MQNIFSSGLLPLNTILVLLLDEADALEDVGDVVDPPLLLHVQRVRSLRHTILLALLNTIGFAVRLSEQKQTNADTNITISAGALSE